MNTGTEYKLMLRDSFEEVDDPNGNLKKNLTKAVLNKFWKNGVPNHELISKTGDIRLVTRAINGLGLANNSRVRVTNVCMHSVKVITMGDNEGQTVRIPATATSSQRAPRELPSPSLSEICVLIS
jgi:hypothetical protein